MTDNRKFKQKVRELASKYEYSYTQAFAILQKENAAIKTAITALNEGINVVVLGLTATGKSTVAQKILNATENNKRIVIIDEIGFNNAEKVKKFVKSSNADGAIFTLHDTTRDGKRRMKQLGFDEEYLPIRTIMEENGHRTFTL